MYILDYMYLNWSSSSVHYENFLLNRCPFGKRYNSDLGFIQEETKVDGNYNRTGSWNQTMHDRRTTLPSTIKDKNESLVPVVMTEISFPFAYDVLGFLILEPYCFLFNKGNVSSNSVFKVSSTNFSSSRLTSSKLNF